jgi:hypothetical protein
MKSSSNPVGDISMLKAILFEVLAVAGISTLLLAASSLAALA